MKIHGQWIFVYCLYIMLLLLSACGGAAVVPLAQREVTTTDLFHEDGVYLFLPHDSAEEQFVALLGVSREQINEATTARHFRLEEANPDYVLSFEGVPAMVRYDGNGFGVLLNFQEAEPTALTAATDAVLDALEQQTGERPQLRQTGWTTEWKGATIRLSCQQPEGTDTLFINALTVVFSRND